MRGRPALRAPLRWLLVGAGGVFVALAVVGVFLPLLPTTPFLLLAAALFAKSSPSLQAWLYMHPRFGPALRAWRDEGAIAPRAKAAAIGGLAFSWTVTVYSVGGLLVPALAGALMLAVGAFILTRPNPSSRSL